MMKMRREKITLRSFPKAVFLYPLFIISVLILIYEGIIDPNLNFWITMGVPPEDVNNYISLIWLIGLFFCLFVISVQAKASKICIVIFALLTLGVIIFFTPFGASFVNLVTNVLNLEIGLPFGFYIAVSIILALILLFIWVGAHVKYVRIEQNEIWCMSGIAGKSKQRFPTRALEINVEKPDFLELLLGTGQVTMKIPSLNKYIQLDTVFCANRKVKKIDDLLSALKVNENH